MSKLFQIKDISQRFNTQFPSVKLGYENVEFKSGHVHAFFLDFDTHIILEDSWTKVSNFIAIYFLTDLDNEFEKWNTYMFYSCPEGISRNIQYKIENDTFGSRKICINSESSFQNVIEEHILNRNLDITFNDSIISKKFIANNIIQKALQGKNIRQRRTDDIKIAFEEIVKFLKNKNEI